MTRVLLPTSAAIFLGLVSLAAAQQDRMTAAGPKDSAVTISGCVKAGTAPDSFLLVNVHNMSGTAAADSPAMVYWLDHSVAKLKPHVGHSVEVTGTIEKERSGEIKVKDEKHGVTKVEVKKGADKVEAKTTNPPLPEGTTGADVVKLKVKSIRMLASSCSAQ